jgi:DNA repair exonuclease SbcCD nuclease subunit
LRFLHTADWQIGMKADHVAEVAERVRAARLQAIDAIGRVAAENKVDFVLVAGDAFEHNQVGRQCARDVLRRLGDFPVDVYIIPGNHDHAGAGSIYTTGVSQQAPPNVHVLLEPQPVEISRISTVLFPCPVRQKRTMSDPTQWIPAESPGNVIRIGIAHGSVSDRGFGDLTDNPISLTAVEAKRLDYLALGHWHSTVELSSRAWYCGTPETTKYSERDSGNVLIVSIDSPGSEPQIDRVRVGRLNWIEVAHELSEPLSDSLNGLRSRLSELSKDSTNTLVRLRLTGVSTSEILLNIDDIADDLKSTHLHVDIDLTGLVPVTAVDKLYEWAQTRPLAKAVLADLRRFLSPQGHDEIAAAEETSVGSSMTDLARVAAEAKLPEDEEGRITQEEAQAALIEMLKALEGLEK